MTKDWRYRPLVGMGSILDVYGGSFESVSSYKIPTFDNLAKFSDWEKLGNDWEKLGGDWEKLGSDWEVVIKSFNKLVAESSS